MAVRILIVDDNEQNRYVISRTLRSPEFVIEECSTGAEALERVKSRPDLVILDLRLPDVAGYEVCRRIKEDPKTSDIAVLQVSAYAGEQGKAASRAAGADGFLMHPLDPHVLVDLVHSMLAQRAKPPADKPRLA